MDGVKAGPRLRVPVLYLAATADDNARLRLLEGRGGDFAKTAAAKDKRLELAAGRGARDRPGRELGEGQEPRRRLSQDALSGVRSPRDPCAAASRARPRDERRRNAHRLAPIRRRGPEHPLRPHLEPRRRARRRPPGRRARAAGDRRHLRPARSRRERPARERLRLSAPRGRRIGGHGRNRRRGRRRRHRLARAERGGAARRGAPAAGDAARRCRALHAARAGSSSRRTPSGSSAGETTGPDSSGRSCTRSSASRTRRS